MTCRPSKTRTLRMRTDPRPCWAGSVTAQATPTRPTRTRAMSIASAMRRAARGDGDRRAMMGLLIAIEKRLRSMRGPGGSALALHAAGVEGGDAELRDAVGDGLR